MSKFRPILISSAMAAVLLLSAGCTRIVEHKGYVVDQALVQSVAAGVDNRASVEATLGRPTFVSEYDKSTWYYISRETKQLAFRSPYPTETTILTVKFDGSGNVAAVNRAGIDQVASISPEGGKTPTLGRDRGFLKELFGNIGRVGGMGGAGQSADNPN